MPHLVPEPLDRGAGHEDGALQGVSHLSIQAPGDGGHQAVPGKDRLVAGVHQQEAAGAVGVLDVALLEAGLAEQGRLLVSRRAGDRDRAGEEGALRLPVDLGGRPDLREHAGRDVQELQDLVVPLQRVDVEQHGPGGVGIIRHMDAALRQLPDQPGLDRAEKQLALSPPFLAPATFSRIQRSLVPLKYGSMRRPVFSRIISV